jgi:hypothetical protein
LAGLAQELSVPITAIGEVAASRSEEPAVEVLDQSGRPIALASEGWTHF